MHRTMMVVLVVALGALIFAPTAFAQNDNPTGDDLRGDDRGGERGFDDNPTGDDVGASLTATATPTASATSTATSTPTASATPTATATATETSAGEARPHRAKASGLPRTGGVPWLSVAAGILLVGSGIMAATLTRRTS
jgi:cytoskeletal protein RodZ